MKNFSILVIGILLFVFVCCFSGCTNDYSKIPGQTRIPRYYAKNVIPIIKTYFDYLEISNGCPSLKVVDSQIVSEDKESTSLWSEIWTIDACGKTHIVPITFVIKGNRIHTLIRSGDIKEK